MAKKTYKMKFPSSKDFCYMLDIDYEKSDYGPRYGQCQCGDDYCRCQVYHSVSVEEITHDTYLGLVYKIFLSIMGQKYKKYKYANVKFSNLSEREKFLYYGFERLCSYYKLYDSNAWEAIADNGYYGEEIVGFKHDNINQLEEDCIKLISLTNDAIIEYILQKEYGYLLDRLKNRTWNIDTVDIAEVSADRLDNNMVKISNVDIYNDKHVDVHAVCEKNGNVYSIIDGHHRIIASRNNGKIKSVTIVYC